MQNVGERLAYYSQLFPLMMPFSVEIQTSCCLSSVAPRLFGQVFVLWLNFIYT